MNGFLGQVLTIKSGYKRRFEELLDGFGLGLRKCVCDSVKSLKSKILLFPREVAV